MRKYTVRRGLRMIIIGILCVMAVTFFQDLLSRLIFLGFVGQASFTFLGFFLAGMFGGCGVLVAAAGLLQSGAQESPMRLAPTVALLLSLIVLFFILAYNSVTTPAPPRLPPGESISI